MSNKSFDWFVVLACVVLGGTILTAGFIVEQPTRIVIGVLFVIMGPLSFLAFDAARKRRRK